MLQDVDDHLIGRSACVEACNTHQRWNLANGDVESRSGNESGDNCEGDQVDDEAEACDSKEADN